MVIKAFKELATEQSIAPDDIKSFSLPEIKAKISLIFSVDSEKLSSFIKKVKHFKHRFEILIKTSFATFR
jgi:hypothetical protein